jgi:translation initiation factor 3 subunit A
MAFRGGRGHGSQFQKPENALKRAEELVAVGQKGSALQTLHDVITSKRHRTWQKILEQIMFRYVDLCVELKKGRYAKDGLIHYRNVCQQVNVSSLEEVIKYLLKSATDKAEEAESKAAEVRSKSYCAHCHSASSSPYEYVITSSTSSSDK